VDFSLSASEVEEDLKRTTDFPYRRANAAIEEALRDYARELPPGVELKITDMGRRGMRVQATGPTRESIQKALAGAREVEQRAFDRFLEGNSFFYIEPGVISYDHARLVGDYVEALRPLARALHKGVDGRREYVQKALSFVQAIPYEARKRNGEDPGYRRPLALLARNRGDCDSKAVLFLALLRAEEPDLPAAVVYLPGHAFTAIGLQPREGEATVGFKGQRLVLVEPTGPNLFPIGVVPVRDSRLAGGPQSILRKVPAGR
jgi:hypothetical protein